MPVSTKKKQEARARRHARVRKGVRGTTERPRLAVFRSNKHIIAQVIDDSTGAKPGILCVPADPAHAALFDRILMLRHGRMVADAAPGPLAEAQPDFARLVKA